MLAVIPLRSGELPAGGLETVAEAGGRALLVGEGAADAVLALAGVGIDVWSADLGSFAPGAWTAALTDFLLTELRLILPACPDGRDLAPRLAHRLGRPLLAGAIEVGPDRVSLARRGGLWTEHLTSPESFVATLIPGGRGVEPSGDRLPNVRVIEFPYGRGATPQDAVSVEVLPPDPATMDLAEAPRIVGGGAGLDSELRFSQLASIALAFGASTGATRVITDRGWVGHERQIGTTGVIVDPQLYLAFGISGAVQHTSGLGTPQHVISVNTDPHCPMMQLADLAIVSDANATLDALTAMLPVRAEREGINDG